MSYYLSLDANTNLFNRRRTDRIRCVCGNSSSDFSLGCEEKSFAKEPREWKVARCDKYGEENDDRSNGASAVSLSLTHASFLFSPLFVAKYLRPAKGQSRSRMSDRQNDAIFSAIILGLIFPQSSLSRPLSTRQCADLNECVCVFLHLCYS